MRVWQVTENDTQLRFYWFQTRKEADAHVAEYRREMKEAGHDFATADVEPVYFGHGRKGIVDALNSVITLTCFNEG